MSMPAKERCSVYTINGFMKGRLGQFRIVTLAESKEAAIERLGFRDHLAGHLMTVSRDTRDWTAFGPHTAVGDVFVVPFGTHTYEPVDPDDVTLA